MYGHFLNVYLLNAVFVSNYSFLFEDIIYIIRIVFYYVLIHYQFAQQHTLMGAHKYINKHLFLFIYYYFTICFKPVNKCVYTNYKCSLITLITYNIYSICPPVGICNWMLLLNCDTLL